jgi:SAM-dependent methyltransferase
MCNQACVDFAVSAISEKDIRAKAVIEVGALDVNGSLRSVADKFSPASYTGVDIQEGPGVDIVVSVYDLVDRFGKESFDVLLSTELLEHVEDWRKAISNLKNVLKPGGVILITTRSRGFAYHGYPHDFWRYEESDIREIFSDFDIEIIKKDPHRPGVFFKAVKPVDFKEKDLTGHLLYSVVTSKMSLTPPSKAEWNVFKKKMFVRYYLGPVIPEPVKRALKRFLRWD